MKNINIISLLILLLSQSFLAQNFNNGIVSYSVSINKSLIDYDKLQKKNNDDSSSKYLINLFENQRPKNYTLYFNKNESYFEKEDYLKNDGTNEIDLVAVHAGSGKFYFSIITKETAEQKYFEDKQYIVIHPEMEWQLTKETKKIGDYNCFKAIANKTIESRLGPSHSEVIAWYAPKIPISFGPNEFNGLPGLIIELEDGLALFKVSKIDLKPKQKIIIKKPTKGQIVTLLEYHLIERLAAENFNKFKGSFFHN